MKLSERLTLRASVSPAGGRQGLLTITLGSAKEIGPVQLRVETPKEVSVSSSANATISLAANRPQTFTANLTSASGEPVTIAVVATVGARQSHTLLRNVRVVPSPDGLVEAAPPPAVEPAAPQPIASAVQVPSGGARCTWQSAPLTLDGVFQYYDHAITPPEAGQIVGPSTPKPIRQASLQVESAPAGIDSWTVVAQGQKTGNDGAFHIVLSNRPSSADPECALRYRVTASTQGGPNDLVTLLPSLIEAPYPRQSAVRQALSTSLSFGTIRAPDGDKGSGPFNIFDAVVSTLEFASSLRPLPDKSILVLWRLGSGFSCVTCYVDHTVFLDGSSGDGDQWDDAVIEHELGHWFMDQYAAIPPSSGGPHDGSCNELYAVEGLAWSEGWAHFFSSASRMYSVDRDRYRWASRRLDFQGSINELGQVFPVGFSSDDFETDDRLDTEGRGNFCEFQVAGALLDVIDASQDAADADALVEPMADVLTALTTSYDSHFPRSLNEWWYGWTNTPRGRLGPSLGAEPQMLAMFEAHSIQAGITISHSWGEYDHLNGHLWLPSTAPYEVWQGHTGAAGAFPFADFVQFGPDPETIHIRSPYAGTYTVGVFNPGPPNPWGDLASDLMWVTTGSRPVQSSWFSLNGLFGEGSWWDAIRISGTSGAITVIDHVQPGSPAPY